MDQAASVRDEDNEKGERRRDAREMPSFVYLLWVIGLGKERA